MADDTLLDTIKRLGRAVLDKIVVPVGVVDDTPPTYADGDVKPMRVHKTNGGFFVHVANATGAAVDAPSIVQGTDGVDAERLATQATLEEVLTLLAPSTAAGVPKAPKAVPTESAEPIVGVATPAKLVRVQAEFANPTDSIICVGDSTVTLANGEQLGPGDVYSEAVDDAAKLFCIGSEAGLKLRIKVL